MTMYRNDEDGRRGLSVTGPTKRLSGLGRARSRPHPVTQCCHMSPLGASVPRQKNT